MDKNQQLSKAILIATHAHIAQFDKGGYTLHPAPVAHYESTTI